MQKYDATQLAGSLNGLAEAFDKKPMTPKALEIWFDALKEFPTHRVLGLLAVWSKHHAKMPVPADVWKAANEMSVEEREQTAAQEREASRRQVMFSRTENGMRALKEIRTIVETQKLSPREHWHKILSTHGKETVGREYAVAALAILDRKRLREPVNYESEAIGL